MQVHETAYAERAFVRKYRRSHVGVAAPFFPSVFAADLKQSLEYKHVKLSFRTTQPTVESRINTGFSAYQPLVRVKKPVR